MADREEQCSTQVEPSSSQDQQAPTIEANDAPNQRQTQDPPSSEQDQGQDQSNDDDGGSPSDVQDQAHDGEQTQEVEQAQVDGQDGDQNDQDDQVIIPPRVNEDIEARRKARVARDHGTQESTLLIRLLVIVKQRCPLGGNWLTLVIIKLISPWWNHKKYLKLLKIRIGWKPCMKSSTTSSATKCGN